MLELVFYHLSLLSKINQNSFSFQDCYYLKSTDNTPHEIQPSVPTDVAVETLYSMLQDDHAEMIARFAALESKVNSLLGTGSSSGC